MLISPRQLVERSRHPRSRADELTALRARYGSQPGRWRATQAQRASADRLRLLRQRMSEQLGRVEACTGCAKNHPLPAGRWDGGHCCGSKTLSIFSAREVAALKIAGTRPRHWEPPEADHAGCSFRGPSGCTLDPVDRPSICLQYICFELRAELSDREDWKRLRAIAAAIRDEREHFDSACEEAESDVPTGWLERMPTE